MQNKETPVKIAKIDFYQYLNQNGQDLNYSHL